ncbi:mitochondrial CIV assembly protein Coa6 [Andalucia godoyi]|uniref:Mitochondrial CIV assembly protein Coa6 n=1 Tax=Andalucia godoyi TaxID=505711 RepID=A0A8K0F4B4_ANDGO|nr:mitochondrial CIV assembly protein Coa6 [Andalucia godoyi]|eukprot:ANDGO_00794.mRNA.1 mitochondrial CIV assembly protein Coa6
MSDPKPTALLDRAARAACYEARDPYLACMDAAPPGTAAASSALGQPTSARCASLRKEFEAKCPASWVSYFIDLHRNAKRMVPGKQQ